MVQFTVHLMGGAELATGDGDDVLHYRTLQHNERSRNIRTEFKKMYTGIRSQFLTN